VPKFSTTSQQSELELSAIPSYFVFLFEKYLLCVLHNINKANQSRELYYTCPNPLVNTGNRIICQLSEDLASAFHRALGKYPISSQHSANRKHLAKPNFDECLIKKHWANYNETLGKHGHSAKYRHMRWACGGHVTAIGCAALPLELCRVFFIDAGQNNVFTECILLALCKIKKIISCPPNFFYSPHTTCGTTC